MFRNAWLFFALVSPCLSVQPELGVLRPVRRPHHRAGVHGGEECLERIWSQDPAAAQSQLPPERGAEAHAEQGVCACATLPNRRPLASGFSRTWERCYLGAQLLCLSDLSFDDLRRSRPLLSILDKKADSVSSSRSVSVYRSVSSASECLPRIQSGVFGAKREKRLSFIIQ